MNLLLKLSCFVTFFLVILVCIFKSKKRKYLPLNNIHLTEGQKKYILRQLEIQKEGQIFGHSDIEYSDLSYVINNVKTNNIDETLLRKLNEYMNGSTLNIGFIKIK